MLTELNIDNLALIEKAQVNFGEHFNVFTGETGAGKSILINGINAILGQRTSRDIVRNNEKKATVRAFFNDVPKIAEDLLKAEGIECEGEICIVREIHADGRSTAKINSISVTSSFLKQVSERLVDIHGQHDSRILMQPETHIDILDNFGDLDVDIENYRKVFHELQLAAKRLKASAIDENTRQNRIAELEKTIFELENAELKIGEEEELTERLEFFRNSENIYKYLKSITSALNGNETAGKCEEIDEINSEISNLADIFPQATECAKRFESVSAELTDIADEFESMMSKIEFDENEVEYTEDRLSNIKKLKKKYSRTVEDLVVFLDECKEELSALNDSETKIEELKAERKRLLSEATALARELSAKREETANRFAEAVCKELEMLNMSGVKIGVDIKHGNLTAKGMDTVEFLISANVGEPLKPISKIASGGELSRIMLSLKAVLADKDDIPTLVFDEIDTGISGIAAGKVGEKLSEISCHRQILCVTHLAQIAAKADTHLKIEKSEHDGRVYTSVTELDYDGKVSEIARIISGSNITDSTIDTAKQMLNKQ